MNLGDSDSDLQAYFQDAETWHAETYRKIKDSRTRAWWLALLALALAITSTLTLAIVAPRHRVELVPVLVNSTSGEVHVMQTLRDSSLSGIEAVRKADLAGYVIARESFDPNRTLLGIWYETVRARSSAQVFEPFAATFEGPGSVFVRFKDSSRDVSVKSVVLLDPATGQVRYSTLERRNSMSTRADWIATVGFVYDSTSPAPFDQRLKNPLGFEVTSYRSDAETLPEKTSP